MTTVGRDAAQRRTDVVAVAEEQTLRRLGERRAKLSHHARVVCERDAIGADEVAVRMGPNKESDTRRAIAGGNVHSRVEGATRVYRCRATRLGGSRLARPGRCGSRGGQRAGAEQDDERRDR